MQDALLPALAQMKHTLPVTDWALGFPKRPPWWIVWTECTCLTQLCNYLQRDPHSKDLGILSAEMAAQEALAEGRMFPTIAIDYKCYYFHPSPKRECLLLQDSKVNTNCHQLPSPCFSLHNRISGLILQWLEGGGGGCVSVTASKTSSDWLMPKLGFWAVFYKRIMYL